MTGPLQPDEHDRPLARGFWISWDRWRLPLILGLIAVVIALAGVVGLRTYESYQVLRTGREARVTRVAEIRPWMSLHYVAHTYGVPEDQLVARLGMQAGVDRDASLSDLAGQLGYQPTELTRRVRQAVFELRRAGTPGRGGSQ
jgi:hypothetical protein